MIRERILFRLFFSLLLPLSFSPFCTYESTFQIHPNDKKGIIFCLVQFQGTNDNEMPRMYLATPAEIAQAMNVSAGDAVEDALVWTLTEADGGYQISAEIDGETWYVYRTNAVTSTGYKIALRTEPFTWTLQTDKGDIRFYVRSNTGKNHFLRYYNSKLKWMSSTKTAWLGLHEIEEQI